MCSYIHAVVLPSCIYSKRNLHCSADCLSYYSPYNYLCSHHILIFVQVLTVHKTDGPPKLNSLDAGLSIRNYLLGAQTITPQFVCPITPD